MNTELDQAIEQKLDELERILPTEKEPHFPREERRYALEQVSSMEKSLKAKIEAVRKADSLELYQISMF
ncbi:hypothetical protein BISA_1399 [Bifidobacterium saguini DSM 23967]|uniref:Uncharacterized protein n=2 Tax=Bifidobacterium saguini TaxID=762210 RepID=A0A087DCR3_9BIFI|nr:hypothetical protein [Bifidobacterium saguini]KFI93313.1 hypothetical protein BISA_1399 [Bifidobacterium saguini DSM 23967]QTB90527.1 hypothetical protein BSD967_09440 [Bifidobacterium saguini]